MQKPSIGRIVHYTLSEEDAQAINRRRTDGSSIASRIAEGSWPIGAQAHIGCQVSACDVLPMLIVQVHGQSVSGQVFLPGSDTFWASSRMLDETAEGAKPAQPGSWRWPALVSDGG